MSDENFNLAGLYRVLISENVPLIQRGLSTAINRESDMAVCGHSANLSETITAIERQMPDVLIVDMETAGDETAEMISHITARYPDTRVITLSLRDDDRDQAVALQAGAKGYLSRHDGAETVIEAIRKVLSGGTWFAESAAEQSGDIEMEMTEEGPDIRDCLTKRELQIFEMIGNGMSTREIAGKLFISQRTVESHRDHIKNKLDFKDAFHLHQFAFGWVNEHSKVKA